MPQSKPRRVEDTWPYIVERKMAGYAESWRSKLYELGGIQLWSKSALVGLGRHIS